MAKGWFCFNGIDSRAYGLLVTGVSPYAVPIRDITAVSVPGRDGDILIDNGRYKNVSVSYHCELRAGNPMGFAAAFEQLRRDLAGSYGYHRLEDSYNEGMFRLGYLAADVIPGAKGTNWSGGTFDLTFSCKPGLYSVRDEPVHIPVVVGGGISDAGANSVNNAMRRTTYVTPAMSDKYRLLRAVNGMVNTVTVFEYDADGTFVKSDTMQAGASTYLCSLSTEYVRLAWVYSDGDQGIQLMDGDNSYTIVNDGVILRNDSVFPSDPTIIIRRDSTDAGAVTVNGSCIDILAGAPLAVTVDALNQKILSDTGAPLDQYVSIYDDPYSTGSTDGAYADGFPSLSPWDNLIYTRHLGGGALSSVITGLDIYPNTWRY